MMSGSTFTIAREGRFRARSRTLEPYALRENVHAEGVHRRLPAGGEDPDRGRRVQPPGAITLTPANIDPATKNLWEDIERLKLDVQTVLPIHGRMVKVDQLKLEAGVRP
jgi:hypothetical protein